MKLIVNGDDFGITHACNLAIIDCFKNGGLRSTSMMTNMDHCKEAAKLMKENPDLSVGIHLCLTAGKPLTEVPSLVKEDGTFNKAILSNQIPVSLEEIEKELEAQIDRFIELTGKLPDHINSHHGIEQIEGVDQILTKLSEKFDRPLRKFMNNPEDNYGPFLQADLPFVSFHPCKSPNDGYQPDQMIEALDDFMKRHPECEFCELALHPGYVDADLMDLSSLNTGRVYDARMICSDEIKNWIRQYDIELADYRSLPRNEKQS